MELIDKFDMLSADFEATLIRGTREQRIAHMSDPQRFKHVPCISLDENGVLFSGRYTLNNGEIYAMEGEFVQIDDPLDGDILMAFYWLYGASQAKL